MAQENELALKSKPTQTDRQTFKRNFDNALLIWQQVIYNTYKRTPDFQEARATSRVICKECTGAQSS
jgi:hypothetical protein